MLPNRIIRSFRLSICILNRFLLSLCLGSGVLTDVFLLGLGRVSLISCFSFLSDFSCFCFSFWLNVSDVSRCEVADASVDAVL